MNRLKLDQEVLGLCSIVERVTHARVIDGFNENEMYYFVVATGEIGKAIGERGINVQRFQQEFGKRVRMIEYNDNVAQFVKNVIYPLKVERIEVKEKEVILSDSNKKTIYCYIYICEKYKKTLIYLELLCSNENEQISDEYIIEYKKKYKYNGNCKSYKKFRVENR